MYVSDDFIAIERNWVSLLSELAPFGRGDGALTL